MVALLVRGIEDRSVHNPDYRACAGLNMKCCLEKSFKMKYVLKSTGKLALDKSPPKFCEVYK